MCYFSDLYYLVSVTPSTQSGRHTYAGLLESWNRISKQHGVSRARKVQMQVLKIAYYRSLVGRIPISRLGAPRDHVHFHSLAFDSSLADSNRPCYL